MLSEHLCARDFMVTEAEQCLVLVLKKKKKGQNFHSFLKNVNIVTYMKYTYFLQPVSTV